MPSPFDTQRSLDPTTGEVSLLIRYNGEECLQGVITGPVERSYIGFVSILKDLEDVLAFIQAAYALLPARATTTAPHGDAIEYADIPPDSRLMIKAYYFAAIALYGRCFVSAAGGRGTTLQEAHVGSAFKGIHQHIMSFRHGLVAHAGDAFDDGEVIVAWTPRGAEFHVEGKVRRLECEDDRQLAPNFEALVRHLIERVDLKQRELLQRLIDGRAKDFVIASQAALLKAIDES